jgi:glycosyltransferase involved in cell wall biosynthesis
MTQPAVSIILPTYNRARFLPQAIESIRAQQFFDWELIIVDDGSTDETPELIQRLTADIGQPVRYLRQENQGAYAARNTGLDHSRGKYIAFFDSDDIWLPHHLKDCAEALDANPNLDWVYGACEIVDFATGKVRTPSTFYVGNRPRPFLRLTTRQVHSLRILTDPRTFECVAQHGLYCGLQNSLIRRTVFDAFRFEVRDCHEGEDRIAVLRALANGRHFGFFDRVHVTYHVHERNSSTPSAGHDCRQRKLILDEVVRSRVQLLRELSLSRSERRALRKRIGTDLFWLIGYSICWKHGQAKAALHYYRRGMSYWPWSPACWKSYVVAKLYSVLRDHDVRRAE